MATINELDAATRQNDNEIMFYLAEGASEEALVIKHRRVIQSVLQDARRRAEGCDHCDPSEQRTEYGEPYNMEFFLKQNGCNYCPNCRRALRGEKEERE